jgi:thymidylate synthase
MEEKMSKFDDIYLDLVERILNEGYYDNNRTGISTYKLPHQILRFNLEEEFPILTTKYVAFKTAIKELLWIFQKQSNSVEELKEQNVHIWDEWEMEDRNNWDSIWMGY